MSLNLIPNFVGTWSNSTPYVVHLLNDTSPNYYISPTVLYNGDLYIANYNDGVNPPVGAVPGVSSLWTLYADAGGGGGGITSVFGRTTPAIIAVSGDYAVSQITGAAPLASPAFTGTPTAPTPTASDSSTKLATTASILAKTLTGYVAGSGSVTSSDSILSAIEKIVGNSPLYSVVHKTANHTFLASEITVIMDSDAKVGTLPAATSVIPGETYTLKLGTGATAGTLAVLTDESLDGVVNGTFATNGLSNSASAQSDGISWYTV